MCGRTPGTRKRSAKVTPSPSDSSISTVTNPLSSSMDRSASKDVNKDLINKSESRYENFGQDNKEPKATKR